MIAQHFLFPGGKAKALTLSYDDGGKQYSLEQCDTAAATYEVLEDRRVLESIFGRRIQGMVYRCCGTRYSRTVHSTHSFAMPVDWLRMSATCHHNDPLLMGLADKFCALPGTPPGAPAVLPVGHSYEFDDNNNWEVIEAFTEQR